MKAAAQALVRSRRGRPDAHLANRARTPDRRLVIDAFVFPVIRWASGLPPGGGDLRHVPARRDQLAADASVQKALAREAA